MKIEKSKYYNPNVYDDLDFINKCSYFNEWYQLVLPILLNDEFQRRKLFLHHESSVWNHSIMVSFKSFLVAKFYNLNVYDATIAGLLHDFYPQAWQYSEELYNLDPSYLTRYFKKHKKLTELHGFVHGKEAAINAQKYFPQMVNERILDSIKYHMFPLTVIPPHYIEGWIVTSMDKKVSVSVFKDIKELPNYVGIRLHKVSK